MSDRLELIQDQVAVAEELGIGVVNIKTARWLLDEVDRLRAGITRHYHECATDPSQSSPVDLDLWALINPEAS